MPIDALAFETQFLAHLAPVWLALPEDLRGRFVVEAALCQQAQDAGIAADAQEGQALRRLPLPKAVPGAAGPTALVASYGDIKVGRRLGYRRFAFLEHGIGQSYAGDRRRISEGHGSYSGGVDRDDNGLFLVPNEHSAERWRRAYPGASVAVVGCPKLDSLPQREGDGAPSVALSFHWPAFVSPEAGSAFGEYKPHLKAIREGVEATGGTLIGHGHPKFIDRLEGYYRQAGIETVRSFEEVCRRADLYVCDNSSSMYEFAATGRPVVVMDSAYYRRNVHHGLRFWDAADVGIRVDGPSAMPMAIAEALQDPPDVAARREAALAVVYAYRSGAAARAAGAIGAWL